jgi:hypothetical protein
MFLFYSFYCTETEIVQNMVYTELMLKIQTQNLFPRGKSRFLNRTVQQYFFDFRFSGTLILTSYKLYLIHINCDPCVTYTSLPSYESSAPWPPRESLVHRPPPPQTEENVSPDVSYCCFVLRHGRQTLKAYSESSLPVTIMYKFQLSGQLFLFKNMKRNSL